MTGFVTDAKGRPFIDKDPNAVLDYSIDLTDWLGTDSIASVTATGTDVTVNSAAHAGKIITAWLSGGTIGATATCRFRWTTAEGRTDDRTIYLKIKER